MSDLEKWIRVEYQGQERINYRTCVMYHMMIPHENLLATKFTVTIGNMKKIFMMVKSRDQVLNYFTDPDNFPESRTTG